MKPDWDKLIAEYEGSAHALIADVDCTGGGQTLCQQQGVSGYPTIKYGDPDKLEDYSGGRTFDDLKTFADANLKAVAPKTEFDKIMMKVDRITKPLQADVEHVLNLRKNAAVLIMVVGGLIGLVLGCVFSRCCCSSKAVSADKKKD